MGIKAHVEAKEKNRTADSSSATGGLGMTTWAKVNGHLNLSAGRAAHDTTAAHESERPKHAAKIGYATERAEKTKTSLP